MYMSLHDLKKTVMPVTLAESGQPVPRAEVSPAENSQVRPCPPPASPVLGSQPVARLQSGHALPARPPQDRSEAVQG